MVPSVRTLPNVDQFVAAGNIERGVGLAQDGVSQRKRKRALAVEESFKQPLDAAAMEFDDLAPHLRSAARTKPNATQEQTEQRVRRSLEDSNEAKGETDRPPTVIH